MLDIEIEVALRNLSDVTIDNLRFNRITRQAVAEAADRVRIRYGTTRFDNSESSLGRDWHWRLAEELNDMLTAAHENDDTVRTELGAAEGS